MLLVLLYEIVSSLRRGEVGLDIVAMLSMMAALIVGQELAAAVIALMYSGGQFLAFAERRQPKYLSARFRTLPLEIASKCSRFARRSFPLLTRRYSILNTPKWNFLPGSA